MLVTRALEGPLGASTPTSTMASTAANSRPTRPR